MCYNEYEGDIGERKWASNILNSRQTFQELHNASIATTHIPEEGGKAQYRGGTLIPNKE